MSPQSKKKVHKPLVKNLKSPHSVWGTHLPIEHKRLAPSPGSATPTIFKTAEGISPLSLIRIGVYFVCVEARVWMRWPLHPATTLLEQLHICTCLCMYQRLKCAPFAYYYSFINAFGWIVIDFGWYRDPPLPSVYVLFFVWTDDKLLFETGKLSLIVIECKQYLFNCKFIEGAKVFD